jgi:lipopolysaccharide exporter
MSKAKLAGEGVKWNYLSMIGMGLAQILFTAIMARLLEPADFGLMAMAFLMIKFGQYFCGTGIRSYLIQKKELDKGDIQASFFLSLVFGVGLTLLAYFLAPFGSHIFDSKGLPPIIQALAVVYLFTGLSITSGALLQKSLRFRSFSLIEFFAYCVSYIVIGIPLAWLDYGVYSLVYAMLAQQFLLMTALYLVSRHSIGFSFSRQTLKKTLLPSTHYSFNSILDFIVNSLPTFIVGRFFGEVILGVFNRANMLVTLPLNNFSAAITKVFFPYIASCKDDRAKLKSSYKKTNMVTSLILIPLSLGMIPAASELIIVILGSKWQEGIPVFQVLAIAMLFHFSSILAGQYADAHQLLRQRTFIQIVTIFVMLSAMFPLAEKGIVGVATGFLIGQVFRFFVFLWFIKKWLLFDRKDFLHMYSPGLTIGVASTFGVWLVHHYLHLSPLVFTLILEVIVGVTVYLVFILFLPNREMRNAIVSLIKLFPAKKDQSLFDKVQNIIIMRLR